MLTRIAAAALLLVGTATQAATIDWNTWASNSAGTISTLGGPIAVTFASNEGTWNAGYPSYTPTSTFADGSVVANAPTSANGIMGLVGGTTHVKTLTFSSPVTNPVMAIWSLGAGGTPASFVFANATPQFVSGGPSAEYGGAAIAVSGNTVSGMEGNGTVRFVGTYSSLSWTNPQYEGWYGFNVGASPVPEPASVAMMLCGLAAVGLGVRRRAAG